MASREAAKSSLFFLFPPLYRNGQENAGKKRKIGKCEKKMPTRHLKSHPAGGQETKLFLRVASVPDVSTMILKDAFTEIIPQLCFMYNLSFASGIFPDAWKIANVIPLKKGGNPTDVKVTHNACSLHLVSNF